MRNYAKHFMLFSILSFLAVAGWSQQSQRTMFHKALISNMEKTIGDLDQNQENLVIVAVNQYIQKSKQADLAQKATATADYQAELKKIISAEQYAKLEQDPKMKTLLGVSPQNKE
jgi:lipopolysaccharide export LptBFGC system permease protein LptF